MLILYNLPTPTEWGNLPSAVKATLQQWYSIASINYILRNTTPMFRTLLMSGLRPQPVIVRDEPKTVTM